MRNRMLFVAVVAILSAAPSAPRAADLRLEAPPVTAPSETTTSYLDRDAVLMMIRATFNAIDPTTIAPTLADDAGRIGADGPLPGETQLLDRQLLTEASYYLVSLRYLAMSGGANWPGDRAEAIYVNDTLVKLDALEDRLIETMSQHGDPLAILLEAQQILALTEGYTSLPPEMDRFANRDALVDAALSELREDA